jgi:PBP1b-binding outer membrane lipoprotein LpoB
MKKLVFLFVAFAAVSFASCGNKAAQSEEATDSVEVAVEEVVETVDSAVVADSAVVDSAVVAE